MYSPFACITDGCTLRHAMQVQINLDGFIAWKVPTAGHHAVPQTESGAKH